MNIFEDYLIKIENTIKTANQDNLLELPENLSGINVDIPPAKFNGDVSTNVAMVLSKINKKPPIELAEIISGLLKKNDKNIIIYQIIRDSINLMVQDVIKNTLLNIKNYKIKKQIDVIKNNNQIVIFSDKFKLIENEIKSFLRHKMYNNKNVLNKNNNGKKIIKKLFKEISIRPKKYINNFHQQDKYRSISDYISGMTDRFAIQLYKSL